MRMFFNKMKAFEMNKIEFEYFLFTYRIVLIKY